VLKAIGSHLFGLFVSSGLYLAWAALGKYVTGWDAFFWLNKEEVGSDEAVTAYCMGFVLLAPLSKRCPWDVAIRILTIAQCIS
jgi:hypothetical protein